MWLMATMPLSEARRTLGPRLPQWRKAAAVKRLSSDSSFVRVSPASAATVAFRISIRDPNLRRGGPRTGIRAVGGGDIAGAPQR